MSFAHPWVLLFLVVPIALAVWEVQRRGQEVRLPFDHGDQRTGSGWRRLVLGANLLPSLVLGAAVVILAGPLKTACRARSAS